MIKVFARGVGWKMGTEAVGNWRRWDGGGERNGPSVIGRGLRSLTVAVLMVSDGASMVPPFVWFQRMELY